MMPKILKEIVVDTLFIAGASSATYGLFLIEECYAWLFAGATMIFISVLTARKG